jgi:hypothetical protein
VHIAFIVIVSFKSAEWCTKCMLDNLYCNKFSDIIITKIINYRGILNIALCALKIV